MARQERSQARYPLAGLLLPSIGLNLGAKKIDSRPQLASSLST